MKVLATSDIHGHLPEVEECDLFIIAGDVTPVWEQHYPNIQRQWILDKFVPWIEKIPATDIVMVAGNHDFCFEEYPQLGPSLPLHYLLDEMVKIQGLRIYGTPWIPTLKGWAFYLPSEQLSDRFSHIPNDLDILVSHGPPHGVSDHVVYEHAGSRELLQWLNIAKPRNVVCGHIHEGFGAYTDKIDDVAVLNVAYLDREYEATRDIVNISHFISNV